MKLGYSTWGMPEVEADILIPHLAGTGYQGIELTVLPRYRTSLERLDTPLRRTVSSLLRSHNLDLPAVAAHSSVVAAAAEEHAANWSRLIGALDLCVDLAERMGLSSPPAMNTTTGGKPEEFAVLQPRLVDRVGEMASQAGRRGVTLAIEAHVGGAIDRPDRLLWLLDQIKSPHLKINFDDSHFAVQGMSMAETVDMLAPHTVHTHIKDHRGRVPDFEFLIPGEGEYDNVGYLRAMHAAGYRGFVTVEVSVMVQRRPDYDALGAADYAYQTLSEAFHAAGLNT